MVGFFNKQINLVDAGDVAELISSNWPESYTLEYKRSLPHKTGGADPWDQGKNTIGDYARDEILAEVVGLANSDGGFVILGMDETKSKPPRAAAVVPQKNVGELARRLEDAARVCIDPPIATLVVHPVVTSGLDGVIVFKVSSSRLAPHRVKGTGECYARRGASNIKLTMREIQEMSVNSARRSDDIDKVFRSYQAKFEVWPRAKEIAAFRVTAIPLDRLPNADRLYKSNVGFPFFNIRDYAASLGNRMAVALSFAPGSWTERPILRGIQGTVDGETSRFQVQHYQTGEIDLCFAVEGEQDNGNPSARSNFYHSWVLGAVANVLRMIAEHRVRVGHGDAEYGIQVEIFRDFGGQAIQPNYVLLGGERYGHGFVKFPVGTILLPTVSVAGTEEFDSVINTIDIDILDALGVKKGMPEPISVSW